MKRFILTLALLLTAPAHAGEAPPQIADPQMIVFRFATVINDVGVAVPDVNVTVQLLEGEGWITDAAPSSTQEEPPLRHALVIDARGKFLMPGLIDVHTHQRGGEAALAGYLYSGVTTVADLGNQPEVISPLRAGERYRRILSPRIFTSGSVITVANGKNADMGLAMADARDTAVLERHIADQKPDFAKLVYDEGGWPGTDPVNMMPLATLRGVVGFYKARNLRTFVHVVSEKRAREAIDAGVTALAHPVMEARVSDDFVKLMAESKIPFATTLTIGDNYARLVNSPEFLNQPEYAAVLGAAAREELRTKTRDSYKNERAALAAYRIKSVPITKDNITRIVAAGGVAALGTDQSNGAAVYREMELLVEAGLSPADVLTIATRNAARFLGKDNELGSVEVGKRADLILLDENPMTDIKNIKSVVLVMKDGRLIDESKLPLAGGPQPPRYTRFAFSDHHP